MKVAMEQQDMSSELPEAVLSVTRFCNVFSGYFFPDVFPTRASVYNIEDGNVPVTFFLQQDRFTARRGSSFLVTAATSLVQVAVIASIRTTYSSPY